MKKMLLAAVACLTVMTVAPAARAQGGGGQGRGRMTEMLFKDITLTDAQKTKSDSIIAHYREMMGPMGGGAMGSPPDSAAMAKRRELMMKQQTDLRGILNAEQQKVFDKNTAEMRERMGQRRPQGR